ncbi:MAG: hypothetical protein AUJ72_00855 [Candidatus Omnitrophica bacterium CG1_02_46_14]|nr:MAG: hypothetical protein AUJ72_00855 [Candidatus Omnitrophica bacterium CG1_02_46_14]
MILASSKIRQIEYSDFSLKVHESAGSDRVIKAQMELTYRCNLHCRHCYTDPFNKSEYFPKEMTLEEIKRILDEMADLGILWLNFTGGEALARKDFFEIYDYAYAKGFILTLYTNGTMFTETIIDRLKERPPFFIDVSCHSATEENFDWFTKVKGSYRNFLKGMELLKASGLSFRMKSIAMSWNRKEWPDIRQFVESFGQPFRFTTSLHPRLNGNLEPLDLRLSPPEVVNLETGYDEIEKEDQGCQETTIVDYVPDRLYRCTCATNGIHINAWGDLGTCTMEYEVRASLRKNSLKEAIGGVFQKVRSLKYQVNTPCHACALYIYCDKKISAVRREFKNPQSANPYACDLAFLRASRVSDKEVVHPLKNRRGE